MSDETVQAIAAAVVTLAQLYYVEPWKFPVFAAIWDWFAVILAKISWYCGWWAMKARDNYYVAVNSYGD